MIAQYPKLNWVICHSPYEVKFDGVENTDWGYTHHELKISFGRKIGSVTTSKCIFNQFCFLLFSRPSKQVRSLLGKVWNIH